MTLISLLTNWVTVASQPKEDGYCVSKLNDSFEGNEQYWKPKTKPQA